MSLRFIEARDLTEYGQNVADNSDDPPVAGGSSTGAGKVAYSSDGSVGGLMKHHIGRDRYYVKMRVSSVGQNDRAIGFIDPFFVADSPPNANMINVDNMASGPVDVFNFDTFNPGTGAQRIFLEDSVQDLFEMNPITFVTTPDPFTGGPNGPYRGNIGTVLDFDFDRDGFQSLFFTGLTDGIPGSTFRLGTNVYPQGLDMMHVVDGNINGVSVSERICWVDIFRRELTGIVGGTDVPSGDFSSVWPGRANNAFQEGTEPEIGADAFEWIPFSFAPDDDSTFTRPKGRIQFVSRLEISTGTIFRIYVRLTEFNPFGVAAAPGETPRTHGRIRLTSRLLVETSPPFDLAGQDTITNPNATFPVFFDHLRNRFVFGLTNSLDNQPFPTGQNNQTVGFFAPQPEISIVTSPAARDTPRTNDVIRYESGAFGDLGEPIAGVNLDWTLTRRSTEDEIVDASTFPGTSSLANFPVDLDGNGDEILVIVSDGTILTEGVDYSVVATTGVVTWITDQSGAALVTATYDHRTDGATPAHGTLLTTTSQTDADGKAQTQISYEDDNADVGTLDHLNSDEA